MPSTPMKPTLSRAARVIKRRRGLPNGRSVVGALLLSAAAIGTFTVAEASGQSPTSPTVMLAANVDAGEVLTASDVVVRDLRLDDIVAAQTFSDVNSVVGSVALGPLNAGQLLQKDSIVGPRAIGGETVAPSHELTIPVPTERTPPTLRRGEIVSILATTGSGDRAQTTVIVADAIVLAIGEPTGSLSARGVRQLTLALPDPSTVVAAAHAAQVADLTIVRATLAATPLSNGPATGTSTPPNSQPGSIDPASAAAVAPEQEAPIDEPTAAPTLVVGNEMPPTAVTS